MRRRGGSGQEQVGTSPRAALLPDHRSTALPTGLPPLSGPLGHLLYILASSDSVSGMPVAGVRAGRSLVQYLDFQKSSLPLEFCQGDLLSLSVLS